MVIDEIPNWLRVDYRTLKINATEPRDMGNYHFLLTLTSQQNLTSSVFWQVVIADRLINTTYLNSLMYKYYDLYYMPNKTIVDVTLSKVSIVDISSEGTVDLLLD